MSPNEGGRPPVGTRGSGPNIDALAKGHHSRIVARRHEGRSVQRIRQALEEHGCRPRGSDIKMRAVCPAHESHGSLTLSVEQGRVGAMVTCFRQCGKPDILAALGLVWDDAFDKPKDRREFVPRPRRAPEFTEDERRFLRGLHIMQLRENAEFARFVAGEQPEVPWDERVQGAGDGGREAAEGHFWRTLARWSALAGDEGFVRRAYEARRAWLERRGPCETHEQTAVLVMRAEDLRRCA